MIALAVAIIVSRDLAAQASAPDTATTGKRPATLDTTVVEGRTTNLVGLAASANQGTVGAGDLALRPLLRPGEIVETIPGVIVTQHSGSGKANQYFLRGFNLDHGTDLAVSVDGVPVNLPSHAHGQGYADLNFLIPELVERVDFRKGPYYAGIGDFGSAGAFDVHLYDQLPQGFIRADGGQFGYGRGVVANNVSFGSGNAIYAGEFEHNDGPWHIGDDERKFDGLVRYTHGTDRSGYTVTAVGYHNHWRATDQVPERALTEGLIDRWGEIDSTDAGATGRLSLSAAWHARGDHSASNALAYIVRYELDLFSNFTYFLNDPVHGDQIEQQDGRWVAGASASHTWIGAVLGAPSRTTVGVQLRWDDIRNGLYHTEARVRLNAVTVNQIDETSSAPYVENETDWTNWFRTIAGLRGDLFAFDVRGLVGGNSGDPRAGLVSPKLSLVFGSWGSTECYLDGGYGFHSNDARGIVSPTAPATPLPRSKGAEVGVRTAAVPGLQSALSLWLLDLTSELVWDGDVGGNVPSGPTRRYGIELANYYMPVRWLTIDADYAWSHARFTDHEAAGDYVPEALVATFDGGLAAHDLTGRIRRFRGGLRFRYFGPRPLTQDGRVSSRATSLVYTDLGCDLSDRLGITLDVFNLLDARASDIDYYYASRLRGEPLSGIDDIHMHPAEPRSVRVTVEARL